MDSSPHGRRDLFRKQQVKEAPAEGQVACLVSLGSRLVIHAGICDPFGIRPGFFQ